MKLFSFIFLLCLYGFAPSYAEKLYAWVEGDNDENRRVLPPKLNEIKTNHSYLFFSDHIERAAEKEINSGNNLLNNVPIETFSLEFNS